ncbi:MAG: hypothetical protein ACT4P7_07900 [Gemmatimonadaceae bacterium]
MRKVALLVPLIVACTSSETAQSDSAAMAPAPPAHLTASDVSGTWTGVTMAENSDSIASRWTVVATAEGGSLIREGTKDSVTFLRVLDADSSIATSLAYVDRADPKRKLMFRSIGRLKDGKLVGTTTIMLAVKPDSIVSRGRFEATRVP